MPVNLSGRVECVLKGIRKGKIPIDENQDNGGHVEGSNNLCFFCGRCSREISGSPGGRVDLVKFTGRVSSDSCLEEDPLVMKVDLNPIKRGRIVTGFYFNNKYLIPGLFPKKPKKG